MDPILLAILLILAMFVLILLHVPIGISMAMVGIAGYGLMSGFGPGLSLVASETSANLGSMELAVVPLFVLMGNFATVSGVSREMYSLANAFLGHLRGGLAMATVGGCGLFGAVCGSSIATTDTFGRMALPEMIKKKYSPTLATGCIAGGGTLGSLVPPSNVMIVYAILSEQFIIDLFLAAIIPAVLTVFLYFVAIIVYSRIYPDSGPAGPKTDWPERLTTVVKSWRAIFLIGAIAVGIYCGIFTVNEAAAFGAILSFALAFLTSRMTLRVFFEALAGIAATTGIIYIMIIGSKIFNYFIVITHLPDSIATNILQSGWNHFFIFLALLIIYIILGSIFDTMAAMVITLPFVLPLVMQMGYSPIWWGIVNVVVIEIGMITPPMGINVFVLQGITRDYPLSTIFKGIVPFLLADFARLAILALFPMVSLWLPSVFR